MCRSVAIYSAALYTFIPGRRVLSCVRVSRLEASKSSSVHYTKASWLDVTHYTQQEITSNSPRRWMQLQREKAGLFSCLFYFMKRYKGKII